MSPINTYDPSRITAVRAGTGKVHEQTCACPACAGLHTFVRPRFFAGQLLTDTELTALSTYLIDKHKLHNRYLHGYGVVCGLQVECDGCGPGVLVRPGYAIDPCGNDIVLPDALRVPVAKLIAQCTAAHRAADCDPPRHPVAEGCDDREQVWCLWVRYHEQQARPVTPLGGSAATSTCGCGSSATGSAPVVTGANQRGSGSRATTCGCTNAPAQTTRPADCEPSRTYEYVEFGVAPKDADCGKLDTALAGTFPVKVVECVTRLQPILTKGLTKNMQTSALSVVAGGQVGVTAGAARDAVCQLYANVVELYRKDPMRTQCVLPDELKQLDCAPRRPNETVNEFRARLAVSLQKLVMLVLLYLRDCVCYAALPPCPPEACDDRVVLACLTVRDGVVVKVCNHACRRYAGSFVNREYWLPIGPVLSLLAAKLCCFPLALKGLDVPFVPAEEDTGEITHVEIAHAELHEAAETHAAAETSPGYRRIANLAAAVRADNFALAKLWRHRLVSAAGRLKLDTLLGQAEASLDRTRGAVLLASYLHADAATAADALRKKGVEVTLAEVADRSEGIAFDAVPRVARGGTATLYTHGGVVVGVRGSESVRVFSRRADR